MLNLALLGLVFVFVPIDGPLRQTQAICAAIYVLVCGFRSFFPRVDLERTVMVDHPLSSIALGRTSATIAEMAFTVQVALFVDQLARQHGFAFGSVIAFSLVPIIALAQTACWGGVLTGNHLWHALEELLWGLKMMLVALVFAWCWPSSSGLYSALLPFGIFACAAGAWVMLVLDVPMYGRRHRLAVMQNQTFVGVAEGFRDAVVRREPTGSWQVWKHEVGWMTPYFSAGVWLSLALVPLQLG